MRVKERKIWIFLVSLISLVIIFQFFALIDLNNELIKFERENEIYKQQIEEFETTQQRDINDAYLCKLASYYGGDTAQRAYNMQVVLNIANENIPIQKVVLKQLYEVEGLNAYEFEEIKYIQEENLDALALVYQYNIDTTNNSTEFIKWN